MSALQLDLPDDLRAKMTEETARRGISESAWLLEAVREKLASDEALQRLEQRATRGDRAAFERVLAKAPDAPPVPGDER